MNDQTADKQIRIAIDDPSLVLLIGPAGSGKSTFAERHFRATEIISSDRSRALICDNEADQSVTRQAFRLVHILTRMRLALSRMTVIDATNLLTRSRLPLLKIAGYFDVPSVAIVLDMSLETCLANNRRRHNRYVSETALRQHALDMRGIMPDLQAEGFTDIHLLNEDSIDRVVIERHVFVPTGKIETNYD